MKNFIRGNNKIKYLEINLTNVNDMTNFINEENNIKYLKIAGVEEYLKNNMEFIDKFHSSFPKGRKERIKKILESGINIERDFCEIFLTDEESIKNYQEKPIPHIEIKKSSMNFDIIAENEYEVRLKKDLKEKENKIKRKQRKVDKIKNIITTIRSEIEINL